MKKRLISAGFVLFFVMVLSLSFVSSQDTIEIEPVCGPNTDNTCSGSKVCKKQELAGNTYYECVECKQNSHCSSGQICSVSNSCVECTTGDQSQCSNNKPHCSGNQCVECTSNSHCSDGKVCNGNSCVDEVPDCTDSDGDGWINESNPDGCDKSAISSSYEGANDCNDSDSDVHGPNEWVLDADNDSFYNATLGSKSVCSSPGEDWILKSEAKGEDDCDLAKGFEDTSCSSVPGLDTGDKTDSGSGNASCSVGSDCRKMFSNNKTWNQVNDTVFCNSEGYCEVNTSIESDKGFNSTKGFIADMEGDCSLKSYSNFSGFTSDFNSSDFKGCSSSEISSLAHNGNNSCTISMNMLFALSFIDSDSPPEGLFCDYENRGVIGENSLNNSRYKAYVGDKEVNRSANFNYSGSGEKGIVYGDTESFVSFKHNFSERDLNFYKISLTTDSQNSNYGYTAVQRLESSGKTIYVDRINQSDELCIKDSKNVTGFVDRLRTGGIGNCSGDNEHLLSCPGSKFGYNCSILGNGSVYRVQNLNHSAVAEFSNGSSGEGTDNNSCTKSDWNCTPSSWSNVTCQDGQKNRTCVKKSNVSCSGGFNPNETTSCGNESLPSCVKGEHYECTVWSDCHNTGDLEGQQTRKCVKQDECKGYDPKESQSCDSGSSTSSDDNKGSQSDFPWTIVLISAGAILVGLIVLLVVWKMKSGSSSSSNNESSNNGSSSSGISDKSSSGAPVNVSSSGNQQTPQMNAQKKQTAAQRPQQQNMPSRQQAQPAKKKVASQRRNLAPNRNVGGRRQPNQANNTRRRGRGQQRR